MNKNNINIEIMNCDELDKLTIQQLQKIQFDIKEIQAELEIYFQNIKGTIQNKI